MKIAGILMIKKALAAAKEEKGRKGAAVAAVDASDPDWTAKAYQKGQGNKVRVKVKVKMVKKNGRSKEKMARIIRVKSTSCANI